MATVENQKFKNEDIAVDGKEFKGCTFTSVTLTYRGGKLPSFTECEFQNVHLYFTGAAANTLELLSGLQENGFSRSVENIANSIRE